ncbi:jg27361 [Pararge aegeria aegeria]|uniref:Jg27361 protein n=1 Tax=Pararge aegeria aegeria TaxID=348720 RepID=A0A8S4QDS3_9NEOP|nr:jg27361 [Pararge aegeria aegeria]
MVLTTFVEPVAIPASHSDMCFRDVLRLLTLSTCTGTTKQPKSFTKSLLESTVSWIRGCRTTSTPVLERDNVQLHWDRSIITDRTIIANKPDIVIMDRTGE